MTRVKACYRKPTIVVDDDHFCFRRLKKESWLGRNISYLFTLSGALVGAAVGMTYTVAMSRLVLWQIAHSDGDESFKKETSLLFSTAAPWSFGIAVVLTTSAGAFVGKKIGLLFK